MDRVDRVLDKGSGRPIAEAPGRIEGCAVRPDAVADFRIGGRRLRRPIHPGYCSWT